MFGYLSLCIAETIQWNPVNTTTVRPKYFGRINGVVVLTGVGIKLQHMCFLMTSCNTDYSSVVNTIRKTLYSILKHILFPEQQFIKLAKKTEIDIVKS